MLRLKIPQHLIEDELLTMHNMNTAAEQTKESPWHLIFRPGLRNALIVGVGLGLIQQLIGINSVIYYATTIFEIAGFHTVDTAIIATCSVGLMNVIATFVASLLMDRLGRRPLLLGGTVGAVIALFMLGALFAFQINNAGIWTILFLFLYIIALALSFGPISWVMSAEIFPNEVRAAGSSLSTFSNWGANFLISSTFLPMVNGVGIGGTFWSYAVIGVFSFAFCWFLVPETKGRSLEDIAYYWMHHRHWPDEESRPSQEKAHN
jgi:sugar porter (SP) family MFS transporter